MTHKAVVLLSGGMDSATALWDALKNPHMEVSSVVTVDYGQQGAHLENVAAANLVTYAYQNMVSLTPIKVRSVTLVGLDVLSGLTTPDIGPRPTNLDAMHPNTHLPYTYVPARNMILLSIAAAVAFDDYARFIVGGWVAPDTPYADCRPSFLEQAEVALNFALGTDHLNVNSRGWVTVSAPVLDLSKREVVKWGTELGVPWELTRSCYQQESEPCMECDSCIKRMGAFVEVGLTDPLVRNSQVWKRFRRAYLKGDYDGPTS